MKDLKKSHNIAGQSNTSVRKSHKHDANLQKNSTLYFQIGLILCLLGSYGILEMKFETTTYEKEIVFLDPNEDVYHMPDFIIEPETPVQKKQKQKKTRIIKPPVIVDNNYNDIEPTDLITDPVPVSDPIIDPNSLTTPEKPEDDIPAPEYYTLKGVEVVPIYPGCEKKITNEERVKCMSEKIGKLVQKKFDTGLASEYGLSGLQRINVQFKIDANGQVTEILTRAPHPGLEKEAERVTKKIPQMKPGLQRKKPVSVVYNLPIVFKVN
ncbi:energy transducer TonB [uncultured Psychroserpens sp.]|uniref:energy transducer TonB n=1 Tax=uncultured Psychroserpens sp. TaxID=255436 RepID=UPI002635AF15|nr:energy transducer TonB [uncultured Psychroserpens sp.]